MRWFIALAALSLIGCTGDGDDIVDADMDGVPAGEDCDDDDPAVNPNAVERCNGIDDNCDGAIDEGVSRTFYTDADNDTYGDPDTPVEACTQPPGTVTNILDCDDTNFDINPDVVEQCDDIDRNCDGDPLANAIGDVFYWRDSDGDGFGDPTEFQRSCEAPGSDWVLGGDLTDPTTVDCDDDDPLVNPGADELCGTADRNIDENCNGIFDDDPVDGQPFPVDADGDGFGSATATAEACSAGDLVDLNGDGVVETLTTLDTSDCNDMVAGIRPGVPELCDGIDNDCDPSTDEDLVATDTRQWWFDSDMDGAGDAAIETLSCNQPSGYAPASNGADCDDSDPALSPSELEVCDGLDNNCDTLIDNSALDADDYYLDFDGDGLGDPMIATQPACSPPPNRVLDNTDCDDTDSAVLGPLDWFEDADLDGYGNPLISVPDCDPVPGHFLNDDDCDDTDPLVNPDKVWYLDLDGDGFGVSSVEDPVAGNETTSCEQPVGFAEVSADCLEVSPDGIIDPATFNPGATDAPADGLDQDCDGFADDDALVDHCGTITADEVWGDASIHTVSCSVEINGAGFPNVLIQPGATVRFADGATLEVGRGSLQASGVTFQHEDRTNPGTWGGIEFTSVINPNRESRLVDSTLADTAGFGVRIDGSEVTLQNVSIQDTVAGPAVSLLGDAVLHLSGSTLTGSDGAGVEASGPSPQFGTFRDNTITGNAGRPVVISAASLDHLFWVPGPPSNRPPANNVLSPNGLDTVRLLSGTQRRDTVWSSSLGVDYEVDGDFIVGDGSDPTLTVEDGVVARFTLGSSLGIGTNGLPGNLFLDGLGAPLDGTVTDAATEFVDYTYGVLFDSEDGTPGTWDGIVFGDEAGDSTIRGLDLLNAGGNGDAALLIEGNVFDDPEDRLIVTLDQSRIAGSSVNGMTVDAARIIVTETRFVENESQGFELLEDTVRTSTIAGSMSGRNQDSAARVYPALVELLDNDVDPNTFFENDLPIEVTAGIVDDSSEWVQLTEDYYVSGAVRVENVDGPILDIAEDVTMYFGDDGELIVGVLDQGSIRVNHDPTDGDIPPVRGLVTMTALAEFEGTTPVNGAWAGLTIGVQQRESRLNDLLIDYGGKFTDEGALNFFGRSIQPIDLRRVTVQNSGSHGLFAGAFSLATEGAVLTVRDSVFQENDDVGFNLRLGALEDLGGGVPSLSGTTIRNNGLHGLALPPGSAGFVEVADDGPSANTFVDNNLVVAADGSADFVEILGGDVRVDSRFVRHVDAASIPNTIPYRLTGESLRVRQGAVLTVDPGVTVEVEPDEAIEIIVGRNDLPGGIVARGTAALPIVFTSAADVPTRGDWVGIALGEECLTNSDLSASPPLLNRCALEYVQIGFAGDATLSADRGALDVYLREWLVQPNPVMITNTVVHDSLSFGMIYYWDRGVYQSPYNDTNLLPPMGDNVAIGVAGNGVASMQFGCQDLDGDQVCTCTLTDINPDPVITDNRCLVDGADSTAMCWNGTSHGATNYFCNNTDLNTLTRDSSNPYDFAVCPSPGPSNCSGAPAWADL